MDFQQVKVSFQKKSIFKFIISSSEHDSILGLDFFVRFFLYKYNYDSTQTYTKVKITEMDTEIFWGFLGTKKEKWFLRNKQEKTSLTIVSLKKGFFKSFNGQNKVNSSIQDGWIGIDIKRWISI